MNPIEFARRWYEGAEDHDDPEQVRLRIESLATLIHRFYVSRPDPLLNVTYTDIDIEEKNNER